jgi:hypothetical protein
MTSKLKQVLARLRPATYNKLKKRAANNNRSMGAEVAQIVEDAIFADEQIVKSR